VAPEIILTRGRYRAEWHHHPANAVEYGLTMFRICRSIRFMPGLQTRKGPDTCRLRQAENSCAPAQVPVNNEPVPPNYFDQRIAGSYREKWPGLYLPEVIELYIPELRRGS
jgi:hypothetical protein